MNQNKRIRGVILSRQGWQKVQDAKVEWEYREKQGYKATLEEIGDKAGLTTPTIRKLLTRDRGVDRRSLVTLFSALNIELCPEDYTKPDRYKTPDFDRDRRKADWGEAVDVSSFCGRDSELMTLERWLLKDRCHEVAIIGMGGQGKTSLSVKFAQQVEHKFERIIWRSIRDAPPIESILTYLIQSIFEDSPVEPELPETTSEKISLLISGLRSSRCLIVLDNIESLMSDESRAGVCRQEHQQYGELFLRVGESEHQSCVILTSREKPKEIAFLEGESFPVRSLQLAGFDEQIGKKVLQQKGLESADAKLAELVKRYDGNPLALKIVGTTIYDLFQNSVAQFLAQDTTIFGDIYDVLKQQFQRLLDIEKKIIYWLAINREPIDLDCLEEDLVDSITKLKLLSGLDSLCRRCLIERIEPNNTEGSIRFTLQSVVMEYVTNQLVQNVSQEVITQNVKLLRYYVLVKATAKDYIKQTQVDLIVKPIIAILLDRLGGESNTEEQLFRIKTSLQKASPRQPGYVAGNILNLLCHLGTDLTKADFSNLCIWQADLQNVRLHDVSFQNCDLSKTIFSETFSGIVSVAFSCDSKILAAGDSNGEIRLWRVADNQPLNVLRGHTSWVTSLDFSSDDKLLASGSSDSDVRLWNVETGECLETLEEHQGEVWSVIFSPDGKTLATGSDDHTIKLWQTDTFTCDSILQGHTSWVTSLAFSSNGKVLASGSDDRTIRFWDFDTRKCVKVIEGHKDGVRSIAFFSDNKTLVSGSDDHTIKMWNVMRGECIKTLRGHSNQVFSIALCPKGEIIASGCHDQTVKLWDSDTGKCIKTFRDHDNWVFDVAFHPKENLLASGSRDQTVKLWNVAQGKCIKTFRGYTNQVLCVCFSPDDSILASGSQDQTIKLWDVSTRKYLKTLRGHFNWVYSVAFSPQGDRLISGSGDKTIKIWDVDTGQCLKTLRGHNAGIKSVAFNPQKNILASGSEDNTVRLWNANTGQIIKILKDHEAAIWSIAFSPDGQTLASGSLDRTIRLWNGNTGECIKALTGHEMWVWSVSFSPDGQTLASSSTGGTLKIWNVTTGECQKSIIPCTGWLLSIAYGRNGKMLAASSQDCTIKLWNTDDYKLVKSFSGHQSGYIWSIAFCSHTSIFASGSEDETIKLWNIETGSCLNTFKAEGLYKNLNLAESTGLPDSTKSSLKLLGVIEKMMLEY